MATTTYGSPYVESSDLVSGWPTSSLAVADRIDDVSFKGNGLNNQTASYTGVLLDAGKTVVMNVASGNTFTIPTAASVAYETGTVLRISNKGAGTTTVQPNGGVTLNGGNISLTQYQSCEVQLVAADVWTPTVKPSVASASGLTLITSSTLTAVASLNVNNCFSATYDNYRIVFKCSTSVARNCYIRMRASGTDNTSAEYFTQTNAGNDTSISGSRASSQTSALILYADTTTLNAVSFDIYSPFIAEATTATGLVQRSTNNTLTNIFSIAHKVNSSYDGISIISDTGNLTGSFRVYGYQNS